MKNHVLYVFLLFSFLSTAQEHVIFERNEKTQALFDESNPYSLVSLLEQNAAFLHYYDFSGIDPDVYLELPDLERQGMLKFNGPGSDIPLVDEYGEYLITELPDGTQQYTYPAPDSMFIDVNDIDKIVFTLHYGDEEPMKRLDQLQIWKTYSTGMHLTLTLDAQNFMKFAGVNIILPLSKEQQQKLIGDSGEVSYWSTLRDSCLSEMKSYEGGIQDEVFFESGRYVDCRSFNFFPSTFYLLDPPIFPWLKGPEEPDYYPYFDFCEISPFSSSLIESIYFNSLEDEALDEKFTKMHYILAQNDIPLVDEYGDPIITYDTDGMAFYTYPDPSREYFFIDYEPTVFLHQSSYFDQDSNLMLGAEKFIFCLNDGSEEPELVSTKELGLDDQSEQNYLRPFLDEFKAQKLWDMEEFILIKSMINNKQFRRELRFEESTIPCEPCANKKGKYALCWKGKRKTKYKYQPKPIELSDGSFLAKSKGQTYLLDAKGRELLSENLDTIYVLKEYEGTYLGQKGDYCMIYSKSGEYSLPMTYIPEGIEAFRTYRFQPIILDGKYFVRKGENGKKGIIDVKGKLLLPYEYQELYADSTYGEIGENEWGTLTRAVGRKEANMKWEVFDLDFKPIALINTVGSYFGDYGDHLLFNNLGQLQAFHSLTAVKDDELFSKSSVNHVFSGKEKGIADQNGKLIIPAKYEYIRRESIGDNEVYFCATYESKLDIYDTLGVLISTFDDILRYHNICPDEPTFYSIVSLEEGERIIRFNFSSNKYVVLFDKGFRYISCASSEEHLANGVRYEGEIERRYRIYRNGKIELVKD